MLADEWLREENEVIYYFKSVCNKNYSQMYMREFIYIFIGIGGLLWLSIALKDRKHHWQWAGARDFLDKAIFGAI
jgi:hypothetical protein